MKYAAVFTYPADISAIQRTRPSHRAYLTSLKDQGKLFVAGPFDDDSGALIVYEAETVEEVRDLITADPFHEAGVFASFVLRPWKQVF